MKRKLLFFLVAVSLLALFAISVSAMEIKEGYVAENGDYEMYWVYGDTAFVGKGAGPKNIAKYEAVYLSTDGTVKDGVFYTTTSMYNGLQVFDKLYVPADYDFTQLTVLPDVYVTDDGTRRNIEAFCGESGGTGFYTYDEYAGELSFTNAVERNDMVEALTYSKYTTLFGIDTLSGRNNLKTVTYNGKEAVEGTLFVSPTVQEFAQGAFGAGNNNDANNIQVLYFEDRGADDLIIGKWSFARGAVEKIIFGSGDYKIATYDTIGYFYNDTGFTLREIVICSGAKINASTSKEVGSEYDVIYAGTEAEWQTERYNFRNHIPNIYNPCYFTGHNLIASDIEYAGGYLSEGEKTLRCTNEGCTYTKVEVAPALFKCLGYSAAETGDNGIVVGFTVSKTVVADYESFKGVTLEYGVFAVSQEKLGDNAIFGENGAAGGVLSADVTKHGFNLFELKIVGFIDEQKDLKLAMGAYVAVTEDEKTTYSYMQDDSKGTKVNNYFFVSYNEIVGAK